MEVLVVVLIAAVGVLLLIILIMALNREELAESRDHYKQMYRTSYNEAERLKLDVEMLQGALQQAKVDELESLLKAVKERDRESYVDSEVEQHFNFVQGVEKLRVMIAEGDDDE